MGNIYVGNLSYSVTEDMLKELFSAHGTVTSSKVIADRFSGRSKGFGFVEMSTDEESDKAIEELNGTEWEGRVLKIDKAKPPRKKRDSRDSGYQRY